MGHSQLVIAYLSLLVVMRVAFAFADGRPPPPEPRASPSVALDRYLPLLHERSYLPPPADPPKPPPDLYSTLQPMFFPGAPPCPTHVTERGPNTYDVEPGTAEFVETAMQARIVPHFRDGIAAGFKLFSIRPGSIYDVLHIQNGDVIKTVNGLDLTSPEKALIIYSTLKQATRFEIELERAGQPLTLTYRITPPREATRCRPSTSTPAR